MITSSDIGSTLELATARSVRPSGKCQNSLRQAVELLAWKDIGSDHARLKHAIISAAHSTELLLKERLRRVNPAFVWENVDK